MNANEMAEFFQLFFLFKKERKEKMNIFDVYCESVKMELEKMSGKDVEITKVQKNNTTITGVQIKSEGNIAPVMYLESFFEDYKSGMTATEIAEKIYRTLSEHTGSDIDISNISDWKYVKDRLIACLIGQKGNQDYLKDKLHIDYLDMAVVFRCVLNTTPGVGAASFVVTEAIAKNWGVSLEDVVRATSNSPMMDDFEIMSIGEALGGLMPGFYDDDEVPAGPPMYIISNKIRLYGAGLLTNYKAHNALREKIGGDYYILPSSVHECIAIPADGMDPEQLRAMVRDVNATMLSPEEKLSDNVYLYTYDEEIDHVNCKVA